MTLLWLSLWQTYEDDSISNSQCDFHRYLIPAFNSLFYYKQAETFKVENDCNTRINISRMVCADEAEKERFRIGVRDCTTAVVEEKIKTVFMVLPIDL